jgi:hypothetical protein
MEPQSSHHSLPADPAAPERVLLDALRTENASLKRELQSKSLELQVTESQMSRVFSYLAGLYDLIPGRHAGHAGQCRSQFSARLS